MQIIPHSMCAHWSYNFSLSITQLLNSHNSIPLRPILIQWRGKSGINFDWNRLSLSKSNWKKAVAAKAQRTISNTETVERETKLYAIQSPQILRHRKTAEISDDHHQEGGRLHDTGHVDFAGPAVVSANICRLVYDRFAQGGSVALSGQLYFRSESYLCGRLQFDIVLDTVHDYAVYVLCNFQRGQPTGEAVGLASRHRNADAPSF